MGANHIIRRGLPQKSEEGTFRFPLVASIVIDPEVITELSPIGGVFSVYPARVVDPLGNGLRLDELQQVVRSARL